MKQLENHPALEHFVKNIERSFGVYKEVEVVSPLELWLPPEAVKVIEFTHMVVWPSRENIRQVFSPPTTKTFVLNYYKGKKAIENAEVALSEYLPLHNGLVALIRPDCPERRFTYTQNLDITLFNPAKYCEFRKGNITAKDTAVFRLYYQLHYEGIERKPRKSLTLSVHHPDAIDPEELFDQTQRCIYVTLHQSLGDELKKIPPGRLFYDVPVETNWR